MKACTDDLAEYVHEKIRMIEKDFKIKLSAKDREDLNFSVSEIDADNISLAIIKAKL